jgi:hypothetical protein
MRRTRRVVRKDSREIARKGGAMISSEVQRTLVKSPPELWAEISDPESLARHLGEFGEIRITRVQPEQRVEWEAGDASGTVVIKPSGWGTKVKLTVTRELAEPERSDEGAGDAETEQQATPDESPALDVSPMFEPSAPEPAEAAENEQDAAQEESSRLDAEPALASSPEPEIDAEAKLAQEAELDYEPQLAHEEPRPAEEPEPEARRGFFARLFGRRRARDAEPTAPVRAEPEPEPEPTPVAEQPPNATAPDAPTARPRELDEETELPSAQAMDACDDEHPEVAVEHGPGVDSEPAGTTDESVELDDAFLKTKLGEEIATEEVTAVLTGVLDRLGAAHHRPFSRA